MLSAIYVAPGPREGVGAGVGAGLAAAGAADGSDDGAGDASTRGVGMRCSRGCTAAALRGAAEVPVAVSTGTTGVFAALPLASNAAALTGTSFIVCCTSDSLGTGWPLTVIAS